MNDKSLIACVLPEYFQLNPAIRKPNTKRQYRFALQNFEESLGRQAKIGDLNDDNVTKMVSQLEERGLAPRTINGRRERINAFWQWLSKRGVVGTRPSNLGVPEPRKIPQAWSTDQFSSLVRFFRTLPGTIANVPAADWWCTLHLVAWDTAERIGALLACQWSYFDFESRWLTIPADARKGGLQPRVYRLRHSTVKALQQVRQYNAGPKVWPWPYCQSYLWIRYRRLRKLAGLPDLDRMSFHAVRRTVATHVTAAGGDATEVLGHSSPATTKVYIDPRFVPQSHAIDFLPELLDGATKRADAGAPPS